MERLFNTNELNWFHVSLLSRLFFRSHRQVAVLFSYQSGEEDWEPANRMLSLGHCRWILANEKQESTGNKTFHFVCSSLFSFSQSSLALPSVHVNLMSRWINTLSTVVMSKSTHNHEVAAMYLPWTTVLCWPIARSFENEELRTAWFNA